MIQQTVSNSKTKRINKDIMDSWFLVKKAHKQTQMETHLIYKAKDKEANKEVNLVL